ncbi:ABC transporter substrate-binding protein [Thioflexithrix psekupsensis]|uniref:ABC transporter substrate-binding protein n=1 Tax=Thioflexithrix psekupsensis TaxID=1570016 RepID=A0A251XA12_9GAMM|nr:ABC transporter substrate binding protein [Thioflexithrix psekupsensis]OUD15019.1 hypothetical protein TPSD3_04790 [Thioflexithrix psekupsensis]
MIFMGSISPVFSQEKQANYPVQAKTNDGKKWRIGYLEGGPFADYQMNLIAIFHGLVSLGWIEDQAIPTQADDKDNSQLWQWLATSIRSDYVEFVADAYWTSHWDAELRPATKAAVLKRLNEQKDIDLMLALGTWAALDLANDEHHTPTVAASVADALEAKIIKSVEDSGYDHLHAKIDPSRNARQLMLFHDTMGFDRLGVVYENSEEGRSYAAINDVEKLVKEREIELVTCHASFSNTDLEVAKQEVFACYEKLVGETKAIYITRHRGLTPDVVEKLVPIFNKNQVVTFSQQGSRDVKLGVLMSIALAGHKCVGNFYAETIAKIFNGALPRNLPQVFEEPPKIAINLSSIRAIGLEIPVELFGIVDEVFE